MYDIITGNWTLSPEMEKLQREKKSGIEIQKRKHDDWNDNYELYRNKVKTNRLTQRQPVNIPLMKETVKTLLSKIDDFPVVDWSERSGDELKELAFQQIWDQQARDKKFEIVDILDKKNVLLYGISYRKLNIDEDGVSISVPDVYDIVLDPLMNMWDLESARFLINQNIFRSVREILADERYTREGKDDLKIWAESPAGILQTEDAKKEWEKKMERLRVMGVSSGDFNYFAGGDRIVNLTEHYTKVWNDKEKKFEKRVVVYADDKIELLNEKLVDLIGVDFWPFVVWCEDPETNDVYPDSISDLVRTPNKVLNVWFSQLIENRTLKNFQMHWFLPKQGYTPQTYTPGPGTMLPAPPGDDINKVIKPVEVSGLDDTLEAINAVVQIVERGTGATAIEKGEGEKGEQTLGEVKILVGKAMERTIGMAKFYRLAWYELATKWSALMHANPPKKMELYKTSRKGKMFPKTVLVEDWKSEAGYEPKVTSTSEQENDSVKGLQKWGYVIAQNPTNLALKKIAMKRQLELLDITPDELRQIEEANAKEEEMASQQPAQEQPVDVNQMEQNIQALTNA